MDEAGLLSFLEARGIPYRRSSHPAVFTVAEAARRVPPLPGAKTKNLFLRDKPGRRHLLLTVPAAKAVDLAALSRALGLQRLGLASAERLGRLLGIAPGAVTPLAVVNDPEGRVELFFDEELWREEALQVHPLVNTATLVLGRESLERFLAALGRPLRCIPVPSR